VYRFEQITLELFYYSRDRLKLKTDCVGQFTIENSSPIYSAWYNKPVVLLVAIRKCRVPLPCSIVRESLADVRIRIKPGWEMDIRKELILAIEEYVVVLESQPN
jgi:hypothetical protein